MFPDTRGRRGARPLSAWAGLLLCGGAISPEIAWARESLTVDLSAGVQAATNPFLDPGGGNGAVSGQAGIDANYRIINERTTLDLGAAANSSTYFNGVGTDVGGRVSADLQHRVSERVAVQLLGHYSYTRTRGSNYLFPTGASSGLGLEPGTITPTPPIVTPPSGVGAVLPPDITLIGRAVTEQTLGGGVNVELRTGARSSLTLGAEANKLIYNDPLLSNYRMFAQSAEFNHALTAATRMTAKVRVAEIKYDNGEHDVIVTPMVGVTRKLSPIFDLSIYGGASIVRSRLPDGTRVHSDGLAVSARLCGTYQHSKLCAVGERQQAPTALGGVRPITTVRVSYYDRLNRKDSLTLDLSWNRSGSDTRHFFAPQTTAGGTVRYDHRLTDRLAVFGSAEYARLWERGAPSRSDLRGTIGITLRLGDRG